MITLKSAKEIESMSRAGDVVARTLEMLRDMVRPGLTTEDLDAAAEKFIRSHKGAKPSFKGLYGFPKTLCVSIDEEIVHGIPSTKRVLAEGSIISIDCRRVPRGAARRLGHDGARWAPFLPRHSG